MNKPFAVALSVAVAVLPAVPAAAQFRAVSAAPVGVAPVRAVPVPPGVAPALGGWLSTLPGAAPAAPTLAAPVLPSAAASVAAPASPASVAAALPAAVPAPLAALPATAVPAARAALNLAADAKDEGAAPAARDLGALRREVAASIKDAGPVADASPEKAQGLGTRLIELLTGPFRRRREGSPELSPRALPKAPRRSALNAASEGGAPAASPEATRQAMLKTLDFVAGVFDAHYAPLDYKKKTFGVQLKAEYEKARKAVRETPNISERDFQDILSRFVAALKDYHVSIQFYSTEMSMLPFSVVYAGGKYYLGYVDRQALPEEEFPFKVGDELVALGGKPAADVVSGLLQAKSEGGSEATDRALAVRRLTRRIRQLGDEAPEGPVSVSFRGADGQVRAGELQWKHVPELIPSAPIRDGAGLFEPPAPRSGPNVVEAAGGEGVDSGLAASVRAAFARLIPSGLNPLAAALARKSPKDDANPFQIGERESFVPALGEVLWKSNARSAFHAYIYKAADGRKVGYVRIGSFEGGAKEAAAFGQLMQKFQAETDALVVDQVNNPGGSLFYMYALLSRLTDKPLVAPRQRTAVGEEDAYESLQTLMAAQQVFTEEQVQELLGPSIDGYVTTLKLWRQMVAYAAFVYQELRAGRRLTELFPFLGVDRIDPHPTERYTKPVMLLVNELDFSCADFFPAILQDNKRVTVFGVKTAGAGGAVKETQFPNQFGIEGLSYTWTIAQRANGQPIENLGVTPDVGYDLTAEDLASGFAGYVRAVNDALARLLGQGRGGAAVTARRARPRG